MYVVIKRPKKDGSTNKKVKEEEQVRCFLDLCTFEEEDQWYVDNRCSHHMYGNKRRIISLKKNKSGKIIIGNGSSTKVLGEGNVDPDIKNTK